MLSLLKKIQCLFKEVSEIWIMTSCVLVNDEKVS